MSILTIIMNIVFLNEINSKSITIPAKSITNPTTQHYKTKFNIDTLSFQEKEIPVELMFTDEGLLNIDICLGTPSQCFDIILDSGSYILWVPNTQCVGSMCPARKFITSQSITCEVTQKYGKINYATGATAGFYNKDKFTFSANKDFSDIVFLSADQASFPSKLSNGIVGIVSVE